MLKDDLIDILKMKKEAEVLSDKVSKYYRDSIEVVKKIRSKSNILAPKIAPLGPMNIYFNYEGKVYSVFLDKLGRLQIKEMIEVDDAERNLMIKKLSQG